MSTLRSISDKKAAKVKKEGLRMNGTFTVSVSAIRARKDANAKAVADVLFGKPKKQEGPEKRARRLAIAGADKYFSEFVRLRDSDEKGIAKCITCGRRAHWRTMDCGHWISRAKQATRYHVSNANAQCGGCNRFQGGKFIEHEKAIREKYPVDFDDSGKHIVERLKVLSLTRCSRTTDDFLFIAKTYKERVAWIIQHEPEKYKSTQNR